MVKRPQPPKSARLKRDVDLPLVSRTTIRSDASKDRALCCLYGEGVNIAARLEGLSEASHRVHGTGEFGAKIPLGAAMNKGLTLRMGQTHVQKYTAPLLENIVAGQIDPSFVVTHPASLEDAPEMYKKFRDNEDGVIKVVLRP